MRRRTGAALAAVTALALSGCSWFSGDDGGGTPAAVGSVTDLAAVCPNPVVIQTDFNPESAYGWTYNLLGAGYRPDDKRKRVRGPLLAAGGVATGVDVEIRAGGPAVDFTDPGKLLYADPGITAAYVSQDSQIAQYAQYPTQMVVAPQSVNPQVLMWRPDLYPEILSFVAQVAESSLPIHTFGGATYAQWLVTTGLIKPSQWVQDYDGSTSVWETAGGRLIQQGFVDAEPYLYEKRFGHPVHSELLFDMGYKVYSQTLGIRSGDAGKLGPCLRRLVPIVQRSQVDFQADPQRANRTIVALAARWQADTSWDYPADLAAYSSRTQRERGLITVDRRARVGLFDMTRVARAQATVQLAFDSAGTRVPYQRGIRPDQLATNAYIDQSVILPLPLGTS